MEPETRYATFRGDKIAYQALGAGPDLVHLTGTLTHIDIRWQEPLHAQFLHRLASFSRLILLDPRGTGASDPISLDPVPTWEDEVDDPTPCSTPSGRSVPPSSRATIPARSR